MRNARDTIRDGIRVLSAAALLTWIGGTPVSAQDRHHDQPKSEHRDNGRHDGQRHIPQHGPPPRAQAVPRQGPRQQRVDGNGHWIGHDGGPHDRHYHLDNPWAHGHFTLGIGPGHVYHLHGGHRDRFVIGTFSFAIAPYDYALVNDWYWDRDDLVIYDDPDHPGWYLVYNPRLGTWAHARYLG